MADLRRQMWFGNLNHQQWVPMPSTGMAANRNFSAAYETLHNGGAVVSRSKGFHRSYEMDFGIRESAGAEGLDIFSRFATGYYDDIAATPNLATDPKLLYFADPFTFDQNVLPPQYATPILGAQVRGFKPIGVVNGIYATGPNSRGLPTQSIEFNTSSAATGSAAHRHHPDERRFSTVVIIPPTHTLHLGFTGSVIGAGAIILKCRKRDGTDEYRTLTTLLAPDSTNGLGTTSVNGAAYAWVQIGLGNTGGGSAAVRLAAAIGQLWPIGITPSQTTGGRHIDGGGHTGLAFADDAITEEYIMVDPTSGSERHYKGLSTTLVEVGASR